MKSIDKPDLLAALWVLLVAAAYVIFSYTRMF